MVALDHASSSNSAFASFRSRVSKPSVNQPYTGASSSRACCTLPWSRQRCARLTAARSSQDFAYCCRATERARSKYSSAFTASRSGEIRVISPAIRDMSASHHLSFVVFTAWMASLIQREASWKSPSSAYACANRDTKKGVQIFAPVDRQAAMPEDNVETPVETLPVSAHKQPWFISPNAVQYAARFSCAKGRSS